MNIDRYTTIHIIGCGGIGSNLVPLLRRAIDNGITIRDTRVILHDFDAVSIDNLRHQNFEKSDLNIPKACVLGTVYNFKYKIHKVTKKDFKRMLHTDSNTLIIMCVDNKQIRKDLYDVYFDDTTKIKSSMCGFIDTRATGGVYGYFTHDVPKDKLIDSLGDTSDTKSYSCQTPTDKDRGAIKYGNYIVPIYAMDYIVKSYLGDDTKTMYIGKI